MQKALLEILAENVKYYRAKTGLSQLKFAMQIEISPSYLNDIESGRQYASLKMLERMAKEFNIDTYQLLLPKEISVQHAASANYENELRTLKEQVTKLFDKQLKNSLLQRIRPKVRDKTPAHFVPYLSIFRRRNVMFHLNFLK